MSESFSDRDDDARRRVAVTTQIEVLVGRLEALAAEQVSKKTLIEDRWVKDLRQYHGRYESDIESALAAGKKSRLFINETRSKTHSWESRLSDMLFPTDDDNWGIEPTPVPEVMGAVKLMEPGSDDSNQLEEIMKLAKARSESMQAEIKDQLTQALYNLKCRQIIHDACKIGCGVMKGPTVENRTRRKYEQQEAVDDGGNVITLNTGAPKRIWGFSDVQDPRPGWERVDPLNYFPDMSARTPNEAEFHFERHMMTKKQLRKLARQPGFDKDAIRELIEGSPQDPPPDSEAKLRDITGGVQQSLADKFHVWEYHGPIESAELRAIVLAQFEGQGQTDMLDDMEEDDPLEEQGAVVWFAEGKLLKYGPELLETGDPVYSVFNFEQDDTNIFGFGVPYLLRDAQAAMNAAWRMTMDNAGLSVGPQIVVDRTLVEPANGIWDLEPRKIWYKTKNLPYPTTPFEAFHIDSRQQELANIIQMAQQFGDDETNMPDIAQGGQGSGPRQTAQGMSMLMNSVNVVFRRVVKNFDDQMTVPNIRRAYDWNMAFSKKDNIKGDFEVDARGSSVLLVRELQAQNLMTMVTSFSDHPVLGPLLKIPGMLRKLFQAHMLPANDLVKSEDELEIEKKQRESEPPPTDPEMEKLAMQLNITEMTGKNKFEIAQIQHETAMIVLAGKLNMTAEQLETKLANTRIQTESSERKLGAEIAMAEIQPDKPTGGAV